MKIAFDIDDTLWKVRGKPGSFDQVPDYDLIQVLRWFYNNGDDIYVWSAGGIDYAQTIIRKLGLDEIVTAVLQKSNHPFQKMDITFDDQEVTMGLVNVRVKREDHETI